MRRKVYRVAAQDEVVVQAPKASLFMLSLTACWRLRLTGDQRGSDLPLSLHHQREPASERKGIGVLRAPECAHFFVFHCRSTVVRRARPIRDDDAEE